MAPSSLTMSRDAACRYFVSLIRDAEMTRLPATDKVMAADLGMTHFLTFADVQPPLSPPKLLTEPLHRVRCLSRALSRKHKASRAHPGASRCRFTSGSGRDRSVEGYTTATEKPQGTSSPRDFLQHIPRVAES